MTTPRRSERNIGRGASPALAWMLGPALLALTSAPARADGPPSLEMLAATRERPLFSSTRRPPPLQERPRPSAQPPQPPDVVLSAIVIGTGVEMAFLKRGKDKTFPIRTGADVDGWSVTEIASRSVVLERNSQSITLEFPKRGGAATVAAGTAPAARPPRR